MPAGWVKVVPTLPSQGSVVAMAVGEGGAIAIEGQVIHCRKLSKKLLFIDVKCKDGGFLELGIKVTIYGSVSSDASVEAIGALRDKLRSVRGWCMQTWCPTTHRAPTLLPCLFAIRACVHQP